MTVSTSSIETADQMSIEAKPHIRELKLKENVGFATLPEQYVHRIVRDGFAFNILVVGSTGVGKSTLIESLFNHKFPESSAKTHLLQNVDLHVQKQELQEKNIKMRLSIAETRGFGDQINKDNCHESIVKYIDAQFENYLQEELKINRSAKPSLDDPRLHCCLYLITPSGHGLRAVDLITMKALDSKVNLIPVIAKSDTITKDELAGLRSKIISDINSNGIRIYQLPIDDPEVVEFNSAINGLQPLAVVASQDIIRVGNKKCRARVYPWGTVQVENESHNDFVRLRDMLLRVNLEDLRESTHTRHYEVYRRARLEQMGFGDVDEGNKPSTFQETFESRRSAHLADLKRREEEKRQNFVLKVKEKEAKLKEAERELHAKFEAHKKSTQEEKRRLEEDKRQLEEEIAQFSLRKTSLLSSASGSGSNLSALTLGAKSSKKK